MISDMQEKMLQTQASTNEQNSTGRISTIFGIAMLMEDWDTCDYIAQHYASAQHFTPKQLEIIEEYKIAAAGGKAAGEVRY